MVDAGQGEPDAYRDSRRQPAGVHRLGRLLGEGTVAVTCYDFRNNTPAAPLLTDYFVVHCHPTSTTACLSSTGWTEQQLTNSSFDMLQAPFAGGFFTGDYEGLANAGNDFTAFFSMPHGSDPSSTFFRRAG